MVEYIDDNQQYVIRLIDNNNKSVQSPKITTNIVLNTKHVYKFVQKAIINGRTHEAYIMELQLKTILRCIWQTRWNKAEHPNYKYLNGISTFVKLHANDADEEYIPGQTITITKNCRHINQDDFTLLQYCLFPSASFKDEQLTPSLWDRYLFILQNLILATNINARKQLKDIKIEKLKEADTDEERQKINEEYLKEVDATKNENTFKLINHLNYLFYNPSNDIPQCVLQRCNHDMLWRFVLLRWTSIKNNDGSQCSEGIEAYLDETKQHDKQEYRRIIKRLYDIAISDIHNDVNLLKFYIAVNIYNYQFVHENVYTYITQYIKLMTNYIVGRQQSLINWETEQLNNIVKSFSVFSIVKPMEDILKDIIKIYLQMYTVKTKSIVSFIMSSFPKELLDKYNVNDITTRLQQCGTITQLFNKYSKTNYESIDKELDAYSIDLLEDVYFSKCADNIGKYTPYLITLLKRCDREFTDKLYKFVSNMIDKQHGVNNNVISLCGCYSVLTADSRYYELIKPFTTATNHYDIDFIIATEEFIPYMNHILRLSYHGIIDELLTEKYIGVNELKGFRKFKIEDILNKLE